MKIFHSFRHILLMFSMKVAHNDTKTLVIVLSSGYQSQGRSLRQKHENIKNINMN